MSRSNHPIYNLREEKRRINGFKGKGMQLQICGREISVLELMECKGKHEGKNQSAIAIGSRRKGGRWKNGALWFALPSLYCS